MIIIICLDKNNGMFFNNRRQSKDFKIIEKIIDIVNGKKLRISPYSYPLFENYKDKINLEIGQDFLKKAVSGEFCFVENQDIRPYERLAERIIVFKWNRVYPADMLFDQSIIEKRRLLYSEDFAGNSHDRIIVEVYE